MQKIKSFGVNSFVVIASILLVILVAETVLRFTPFRARLVQLGSPFTYIVQSETLRYDIARNVPTTTHEMVDGTYPIWSNGQGCFDHRFKGEEPYIYLAGDSFTWGYTPFEYKWGTLLEKHLGIRTLKCGVSGYGTLQSLGKARHILANLPAPRAIVLMHFFNDVHDDRRFDLFLANGNPRVHPIVKRVQSILFQYSILYNIALRSEVYLQMREVAARMGLVEHHPTMVPLTEDDYGRHFGAIREFTDLAREKGALFFVILAPSWYEIREGESNVHRRVRTFLDENNIRYLDLLPEFRDFEVPDSTIFWPHDAHWNTNGNIIVGALVSQFLEREGMQKAVKTSR